MTSSSTERLTGWLQGIALGGLLRLTVIATPVPASRPRVARNGGVFYPKPYQEFLRECQTQFSKARNEGDWPEGPLEGPLAVAVDVRHVRPRTTKLPAGRGDVDNHAKGPLDALTKLKVWGDDGQITRLNVQKRWAEEGEESGIDVWIGRLEVA